MMPSHPKTERGTATKLPRTQLPTRPTTRRSPYRPRVRSSSKVRYRHGSYKRNSDELAILLPTLPSRSARLFAQCPEAGDGCNEMTFLVCLRQVARPPVTISSSDGDRWRLATWVALFSPNARKWWLFPRVRQCSACSESAMFLE